MSAKIGLVSGTWGHSGTGSYAWWRFPSVFIANLRNAGLDVVSELDGFDWSTDLDGIDKGNDNWNTSGKALYWWWRAHGAGPLSLIGHSHGPQAIAYALAYSRALYKADPKGVDSSLMILDHLVTVGTPVRQDMQPIWDLARPLVKDWTHIYSNEVVNLFDGDLGYQEIGSRPHPAAFPFRRTMAQADRNVEVVPAVTHHDLMQPRLWLDRDLFQYLRP